MRALLAAAVAALIALPAPVRADSAAIEYVDDAAGSETGDDLTPHDAVGYRGGRKVKIKVIAIGYEWMDVATGKAYLAMRDAARAEGYELYVYSGFRSMEQQQRLYQAYKEGWGNKAAKPGHSNHQLGKALDIYLGDTGVFAWLEAHGREFGFKRTVPGEPWHWEYVKKPKKSKKARKAKSGKKP